MHYLLGEQHFYFPSSNDPSYTLQEFLENKRNQNYYLPIIVKITSLDAGGRAVKNLLTKNTPLLLIDTYRFESILAEYSRSSGGRYHSSGHRLNSTQGNLISKKTKKFRTTTKPSRSLVTLNTTNPIEDNSDDEYDNTRNIIRILNEKRSSTVSLCRVPINYHGFFELLNENNQAIEPFRRLTDLLIIEHHEHGDNQQIRTQTWPHAFFLRSACPAYTRRYIPDERKLSGSADSCYGSLSDLDAHKNLLILNDDRQTLQPGQIITILNPCSAYRSQLIDQDVQTEQFLSHSSSTSWLRTKSRLFVSRKKCQPSHRHSNRSAITNLNRSVCDIPNKSEPYLKCQTERGDIIYIALNQSGLFSPLNSSSTSPKSVTHSNSVDLSGVFQLKELMSNFRFPISVRLLNNSISFDNIFSPASISQADTSFYSSTKFRLLLPYTEQVVFACPLILPSSMKSQIIVIPIPLNSQMEIQRCLNMREISKNKYFHNLIQTCYHSINQYQREFSFIHFPLVFNLSSTKRKHPLYKKRSQSESHLDYYSLDSTRDSHRRSCEILSDVIDDESYVESRQRSYSKPEQLHYRDSFETSKQRLATDSIDRNQRQQATRRSGYYAKLKIDKPRRSSRAPEYDSEDENYRDMDHIYDFIRSGDLTDDVQRIQAKEQALNTKCNQMNDTSTMFVSNVLDISQSLTKKLEGRISSIHDSVGAMKAHRFPHSLDDSRPLNDEDDDDDDCQTQSVETSRWHTDVHPFESIDAIPITKMKRLNKN